MALPDRARYDVNKRDTLMAVSSVDGESPVTLWADPNTHTLITSAGGGGGSGDGAILDGVNGTIKATVFSLTNSKPLATQIVDATGSAITSFGGGTQYTNGQAIATGSIVGTAGLGYDGANLRAMATDTSGNAIVVGNVASGATDSGNPLKVGGIFSTQPTLTVGQRGDLQLNARGELKVTVTQNGQSAIVTIPADGSANTNAGSFVVSRNTVFNGTTWDRMVSSGPIGTVATAGNFTEQTGLTAAALNADLVPSTDVSAYKFISLQINGTYSGTLSFQGSNDNTNFVAISLVNQQGAGQTPVNSVGATGVIFGGPVTFRYLRVRMTGYSSGTATGILELHTLATPSLNTAMFASQTGTWTVGSNSAIAATVPTSAFFIGVRNGTGNLQGVNSGANQGDGSAGDAAIAETMNIWNGASYDRLRGDATNGAFVQVKSNTPGTGSTNLGKAEDAAHVSGDTGVFILGVRNDGGATTFTNANGDYSPAATDQTGSVHVVQKAQTATLSNVAGSATTVNLLAANNNRKGAQIYNDSTAILYVKLGTTASTTSFTAPLAAGGYYEVPAGYVGAIDGIWASATGAARVTEEA